jgi:Ser/Thr protein kinase RdoA (MazF antagonist)
MHEWLRSRHDSMATPQPLIDRWIQVATGSAVHTAVRIIVGQDNEVHDVVTTDGHRIVVRISHRPDPRFTGERWALDAARALGVPTPRVLLIDQVDHIGSARTPVTVCVEDKLPGVSLRTLLDAGHRPVGAIAELGELLARIHQVRVDGFGYLRAEGRGWDIPFSAVMLDLLDRRTDLHRAATHWAEPVESVEQGLAVLDAHRSHFAFDDPRLVHGDLGADHILISDDRVTGIIDFQECSGNHPVLDLAHWDPPPPRSHRRAAHRLPTRRPCRHRDRTVVRTGTAPRVTVDAAGARRAASRPRHRGLPDRPAPAACAVPAGDEPDYPRRLRTARHDPKIFISGRAQAVAAGPALGAGDRHLESSALEDARHHDGVVRRRLPKTVTNM